MVQEKSAGVVVFRKNSKNNIFYLILHYPHGHWAFPKGGVEKGENERETAKREVKEETDVGDLQFLDFKDLIEYFYKKKGEIVHKKVVYFLAQTKTKKIKLSYEHKGYKWLGYKKALERLTFKNSKKILRKAHKTIKNSLLNNF